MEKPGWVPYEKFIEHLRLFPIPCIDLLIDVKGRGIAWGRRLNPPMQGQLATFGVRALMIDDTWEGFVTRVGREEVGMEIDPNSLDFVGQQLVRFSQERDGVERLDVTTCWSLEVGDVTQIIPNPKNYSAEIVVSYEIPMDAGQMYQKFGRQYKKLKGIS